MQETDYIDLLNENLKLHRRMAALEETVGLLAIAMVGLLALVMLT